MMRRMMTMRRRRSRRKRKRTMRMASEERLESVPEYDIDDRPWGIRGMTTVPWCKLVNTRVFTKVQGFSVK